MGQARCAGHPAGAAPLHGGASFSGSFWKRNGYPVDPYLWRDRRGGILRLFHDAMGYWGTTLVLLGAIVIDVLMLTHWSLSRGAQKVGSKAQVLGKKTGEKIEAATTRLRERKRRWMLREVLLGWKYLMISRRSSFTRRMKKMRQNRRMRNCRQKIWRSLRRCRMRKSHRFP